jgi:L-fuconolactonase
VIDAHHHLWRYNDSDYVWMSDAMTSLRRDFLVPDLEQVAQESGIEGTIAVQARQTTEETEWLLDLATRHHLLQGVVGWVPLCEPDVARFLERFAAESKFKGVRHVLHDEPDDCFMLRADFNRGISLLRDFGIAYDILIFERHLPQTIEFVDRHPNQIFVLDHIGKPRIKERIFSPWEDNLYELARRENVYCKVSGMATEAHWTSWQPEQLRPYFDVVLAAFGPKRLMFGSDWPVVTLAGEYAGWVRTFRSFIAELSPAEQESISSATAKAAYVVTKRQ